MFQATVVGDYNVYDFDVNPIPSELFGSGNGIGNKGDEKHESRR